MSRRISSTRLKIYRACKRKYWFSEVLNKSVYKAHFAFGTYAHALAEWHLNGQPMHNMPKLPEGMDSKTISHAADVGAYFATLTKNRFKKIVGTEEDIRIECSCGGHIDCTLDCVAIDDDGSYWVVDHKTSSDPARYAKSKEALGEDLQALVYAYALCYKYDLEEVGIHFHWVHSKPKGAHISDTVVITELKKKRSELEKVIEKACADGKLMLALDKDVVPESAWELDPGTSICSEYGGCDYAGMCMRLTDIKSREKKEVNMDLLSKLGITEEAPSVNPKPEDAPETAKADQEAPPKAPEPAPKAAEDNARSMEQLTADALLLAKTMGITGDSLAGFILGYICR